MRRFEPVAYCAIQAEPLSCFELHNAVHRAQAGAVATFTGVVREQDQGRAVRELEYLAHPSAQEVLAQVLARAVSGRQAVAVAAAHRVGSLVVGEVALVVAVSAEHRGPAFATCAQLVDDIKATVPIWKRQVFEDGQTEWVGLP